MGISLENLVINRIIAHEILRKEEAKPVQTNLSDNLSDLSPVATKEVEKRVVQALGNNSHAIEMKITQIADGSVFQFVKEIMEGDQSDKSFISSSQNIAEKLAHSHFTRNIPGGAVIVFEGVTGAHAKRYLGIIKADKHSGFTTLLDFIQDIILSPQQKLYKVAMLVDCLDCGTDADRTPDDFKVYIFDSNNDKINANSAAGYFYSSFMGCEYPKTAPVLTRSFYNFTEQFISQNMTGEDLVNAKSALVTYLKFEQTPIISANEFATRYLKTPEQRDEYEAFMKVKGVEMAGIPKDTQMLKLKSRRLKFNNKVSIQAPTEDFSKNVEIIEATEQHTTVKIMGKIIDDV